MSRINVTKSSLPNREQFHEYVDKILNSGWLTNRGPLIQQLERRLEDYLGVKNIVLVANGTMALQVAYKLLELKGEVITTPFTFVATASSLVWEGLTPVFSDINRETFNLDAKSAEKKITKSTTAILPVHVFGNPCDIEAIDVLAKQYNLKVIYDASHAFSVKYKGESVLQWGDISTLSFHATKLFHTIEGGALIIKDDALCKQARRMITFGFAGPESIECLGINAKMNELQAAMGLCLLDCVDSAISRRSELTSIYDAQLKDIVITQSLNPYTSYNYSYYPILLKDERTLLRAQSALNSKNIYPRRYFYPSLDTLNFLSKNQTAPVSREISKRVLCLPLSTSLTNDQCQMISNILINEVSSN